MGRRFSARVENGAHRHGEVWQEGGGCGVAAAENHAPHAFSSRASRLRGESPAQDSPRSGEEREDFAKKNPPASKEFSG